LWAFAGICVWLLSCIAAAVPLLSPSSAESVPDESAAGSAAAFLPYLSPSVPSNYPGHVRLSLRGPGGLFSLNTGPGAALRKRTSHLGAVNRAAAEGAQNVPENASQARGSRRKLRPLFFSPKPATLEAALGSAARAAVPSFIDNEPQAEEASSLGVLPATGGSSAHDNVDKNKAAGAAVSPVGPTPHAEPARPAEQTSAAAQSPPVDLPGSGGIRQEQPAQESFKEAVEDPKTAHRLLDKFMYHLRDVMALRAEQIRRNAGDLTFQFQQAAFATNMRKVCDKLRPRYVEPASPVLSWMSRVFHRLGGAFKKREAVVRAKILRWMKAEDRGVDKKEPSKAYKFLKKLAKRAWKQTVRMATHIVAQIMRMLPLICTILNVAFLGLAISSVVVAPTPFAIVGLVALVLNIMSWAFSTGSSIHGVAVTRVIASGSQDQQIQLFGLLWADLKAEEESADIAQVPGGEPSRKDEKPRDAAAEDTEAMKLSQQINSDDLDYEIVPEPSTAERLREIRAQMHKNLLENHAAEERRKLKGGIKEAWRSRRWRAVGKILGSSLRLLLEYANHAVQEVLSLFGSAWHWVVDQALRKSVRQLRMFKLFGRVSLFGEKLYGFLQWLMLKARYYLEYTETIRDLATFVAQHAPTATLVFQGGLGVTPAGVSFLALFLWKISKPLWKFYLTEAALKTADITEKAATEFMDSQTDFHNFLLGTRAILGDGTSAFAPAIDLHLPQHEATELIFLMVYLEKYRFPEGKTREIGMVKEMDPMTQFVAYERVRRLQQIFEKIPEKSRNQFKELFVDLKRWNIGSTAESLHEFLFNHIQHCALLYGRKQLIAAISNRIRLFQPEKGRLEDWVYFKPSEIRGLAQIATFIVTHDAGILFKPLVLSRHLQSTVTVVKRKWMPPIQLEWLSHHVVHAALTVLEKEVIFKLDERHEAVLDRTSLRVNNLPFSRHGDTIGLTALLQDAFTVDATSFTIPTSPSSKNRSKLSVPLWRRGGSGLAGQVLECPRIVPEVEINHTLEYAKLRFLKSSLLSPLSAPVGTGGSDPGASGSSKETHPPESASPDPFSPATEPVKAGSSNPEVSGSISTSSSKESHSSEAISFECAQHATAKLLTLQVLSTFRAFVRKIIFGVPAHVCAPFEPPGYQAVSGLIDEMVNQGLSEDEFADALHEGIQLLADEHSSLVMPLAIMHTEEEAWSKRLARRSGQPTRKGPGQGLRTKPTQGKSDPQHSPETPSFLFRTSSKSPVSESLPGSPTAGSGSVIDNGDTSVKDEVDARLQLVGLDVPAQERKSAEAALEALRARRHFINSLHKLRRLNSLIREQAFANVLFQYVSEVLPATLRKAAVPNTDTSHFQLLGAVVKSYTRHEPGRLVEYIRERVRSTRVSDLLASEGEAEESGTLSDAAGRDTGPKEQASETTDAQRVLLDAVIHIFAEKFGAILQGENLVGRGGSDQPAIGVPKQTAAGTLARHQAPLETARRSQAGVRRTATAKRPNLVQQRRSHARIEESVKWQPSSFMDRSSFNVVRDTVWKTIVSSVEETETVLQNLENDLTGSGSSPTETPGPARGPSMFLYRVERVATLRAHKILGRFIDLRIQRAGRMAAESGAEHFPTPLLHHLAALRDGLHSARRAMERNVDKIATALRWGYWLPDNFACLRKDRKSGIVDNFAAVFENILRTKVPFLSAFWGRFRRKLGFGSRPKPPPVRAKQLALDLYKRLEGLFDSGLDGMYGSLNLRYGYRPTQATQTTQPSPSSRADQPDGAQGTRARVSRSASLNSFFIEKKPPPSRASDGTRTRSSSVS
ncbi:transmembrane protein, partial [Cystoisospora suis]